jgi:hypothetical protein
VAAFETTILKSSPSLREGSYSIESKQIRIVEGVRHEFDIVVTVDGGAGYMSTFLSECKNWQEAVGKNVIILRRTQ